MKRLMHTKLHAVGVAIGLTFAGAAAQAGPWVATALGGLNGVADPVLATGVNDRGEVMGVVGTTAGRPAFLYSGGTMTNLGAGFSPTAINNQGQVLGSTSTASGATQSVTTSVYSGGVMTTVGPSGTTFFVGKAINNNGVVAGGVVGPLNASDPFGRSNSAAVVSGGVVTELGSLPYYPDSFATGINDAGTVIGASTSINSYGTVFNRAFVYSNGVLADLGSLGGGSSTTAAAINAAGAIAGNSGRSDGSAGAFIYSQGVMTDLGSLYIDPTSRYRRDSAADINDAGWVVGTSMVDYNHSRGFLYNGQTMIDLGALSNTVGNSGESAALSINNAGQVLGTSVSGRTSTGGWDNDYFLWESGVMLNLDDLVADLGIVDVSSASLANGYIAGFGKTSDGSSRSFLLSQVSPVPEPTTLALMALGLLAGAAQRGRRR